MHFLAQVHSNVVHFGVSGGLNSYFGGFWT